MFYLKYLFQFVGVFFLIACSGSPKPSDEVFAKEAVHIKYSSSEKQNMYDNQPHVIPLVVYELSDKTNFDSLKKDKDGIIKLLAATKFDKSVISVEKFFILPNEKKELILDRSAKTGWIGLVAGYYDMEPSQSTLTYQIPSYTAWEFWNSEYKQKLLSIELYFDKSSIEKRQE